MIMMGCKSNQQPHAVCIPAPFQSHIKAMLNLAKLLYAKNFHITFINTEFNHKRLLKARGPDALTGLPGFRFEAMPDGLPPSPLDAGQDVPALARATMEDFSGPFRDVMARINEAGGCPATCIVTDGFLTFPIGVGEDLGIPVALFFTISACALLPFFHYGDLRERGLSPLKDESYLTNGFLDNTAVDFLPGLNKAMRLKDLPSFFHTTDPNDTMLNFGRSGPESSHRASAVVIHTFDALESPVLSALAPDVLTIAPIHLLLNRVMNQIGNKDREGLCSIQSNLLEEDSRCLRWLEARARVEPRSVLYVNFGSVAVMSACDLIEFAHGLADSGVPFLWVVRPDLVIGEAAVLPPEILRETEGRGLVAGWCAQEAVLAHPAVGGFLTHCGWNSMLESLAAGVPMACWTFFGDQPTNAWYACNEWGVGAEVERDVRRGQVEGVVREVMKGAKGKAMKSKAMEWKRKAMEATGPLGSSSLALNRLTQILLSKT